MCNYYFRIYFEVCNFIGKRLISLNLNSCWGMRSHGLCGAPAGMWWHWYCSCYKWKLLYLDKLFQHTPIIKSISYQGLCLPILICLIFLHPYIFPLSCSVTSTEILWSIHHLIGLNLDNYFLTFFRGLSDVSLQADTGIEITQFLLNHFNDFASRGFTKNIIEDFI